MPKESAPGAPGKVLTDPRSVGPGKRREISEKLQPESLQAPTVTEISPDPPPGVSGLDPQLVRGIVGVAAVLVLIGAWVFWWNKSRTATSPGSPDSGSETTGQPAPALQIAGGAGAAQDGITPVGTADELSKPWATKKFTFVKPYTLEKVSALAVRLPSGELWGFALQTPYGRCELEFVADVNQLASQFGYQANHPMIVSPCDGTVYDPLKVGPIGDTWARGEIVKGTAVRPPLSINLEVNGNSIVADRME